MTKLNKLNKVKSLSPALTRQPPLRRAAFVFLISIAAGCGRNDVKVYHVTEDNDSAPSTVAPNNDALPQLHWTLPSGWQEIAPSQMRAASFNIESADGKKADVGVIPLPANGQELQFVNMWREQMQLPPATNVETEAVSIGAETGKLFDIASAALLIDGKYRGRILVAMLTRNQTSWFFKMTGEDSLVASQKENFLQFLKSISFGKNGQPTIVNASATENPSANPNLNSIWTIPSDWKSVASPSSILLAQFSIQTDSAQAEVNVAEFAGDAGGLAANVNRWRGQLGLPAADETEFSKSISTFDVPGGKATLVDFAGTDAKTGKLARLTAVVVPRNGETWFYKLMGDPQIVAQQKDAFLKFIQSAKYPDAR